MLEPYDEESLIRWGTRNGSLLEIAVRVVVVVVVVVVVAAAATAAAEEVDVVGASAGAEGGVSSPIAPTRPLVSK